MQLKMLESSFCDVNHWALFQMGKDTVKIVSIFKENSLKIIVQVQKKDWHYNRLGSKLLLQSLFKCFSCQTYGVHHPAHPPHSWSTQVDLAGAGSPLPNAIGPTWRSHAFPPPGLVVWSAAEVEAQPSAPTSPTTWGYFSYQIIGSFLHPLKSSPGTHGPWYPRFLNLLWFPYSPKLGFFKPSRTESSLTHINVPLALTRFSLMAHRRRIWRW